MAFNFLGTLSIQQLQELRQFVEVQIYDIDQEIKYLIVEMNNLNITLESFSQADMYFGGDTISNIYKIQSQLNDQMQVQKTDDSCSAKIMVDIKKPFITTIKYKLERNEYKMKKIFDVIEQTRELIERKSIAKSKTINLLNDLEKMFSEKENSTFLFKTTDIMNNFFNGNISDKDL
jgi:hypothetical protein